MAPRYLLIILLLISINLSAQTDYNQTANWYYHPEKPINLIANYELDIAFINPDLSIDSTLTFPNQTETNTGVDVFWVHPTQLTDPPNFPTNIALADQPFALIASTILAQGALLGKYGRFYAPRYQQASPAAFLDVSYSEAERAAALVTAYRDIKAAFEHYLATENDGNRIILAGHSQGSFLLAMLLRDLFDQNPELQDRLVMAALGGMPYIHASEGSFTGGQWEHIPLCTSQNQCGCIHSWRSFKETQFLPNLVPTLPIFNASLVDSGLVFRTANLDQDWFIQDSLYYGASSTSLRNYIVPDAGYNLGGGANFLAFDNFYSARFRRENKHQLALAVDYPNDPADQRPNDLLELENSPTFLASGFHNKDYHIYLWALLDQIDAKLAGCNAVNATQDRPDLASELRVYPNPSTGWITIEIEDQSVDIGPMYLYNAQGQLVQEIGRLSDQQIQISQKGIYFLRTQKSLKKIIIE
ncbi:MAG: DUF3089 domain-containing protein [Bacteroidota bacterium]